MKAVVLLVLGAVALVAYEIRADRRVRRSTAGAAPVVIVRGLKPRWWRGLVRKGLEQLLTLAILAGLLLAALHVRKGASPDVDHRWPFPTAPAAGSYGSAHPAPSGSPMRKGR